MTLHVQNHFLLLATNTIEKGDAKAFSFSTIVAKKPIFTEEGILLNR